MAYKTLATMCHAGGDIVERLRRSSSNIKSLSWEAADEIARLRAAEDYDLRCKKSLRAEIERLRALLRDKDYIRLLADYNRGHLSHYNYLQSKEHGLGLDGIEDGSG